MKRNTGFLVAALCLGCLCATPTLRASSVSSGEAVIREMFHRYENDWYETMKFTQKSTTYNPDGTTKVETWYEAAILPGNLRIDFGEPADGNAAILTDGKVFFFQKGKLAVTRPQLNLLLVLGFDVYRQKPEVTLAQVKQEGIDISKFHEETWQGEPSFVVGAEKGDLKSKQFWVEKKRMLFVRIIEPDRRDSTKLDDTRFLNYRRLPHGLIAERVEVHSEGKLTFSEDYSAVETEIPLDRSLFDPQAFETQHQPK